MAPDKVLGGLKWFGIEENNCVFDERVYRRVEQAVTQYKRQLLAPCCYLQGWRYFLAYISFPLTSTSRAHQSASKTESVASSDVAAFARRSLWAQLKAPLSIRKEAAAIITRIRRRVERTYFSSREQIEFFISERLEALFSPLWSKGNNFTLKPIDDRFALRFSLIRHPTEHNALEQPAIALVGVHMRVGDYYASHKNIMADWPYFLAAAAHLISRFKYVSFWLYSKRETFKIPPASNMSKIPQAENTTTAQQWAQRLCNKNQQKTTYEYMVIIHSSVVVCY